MRDLIECKNQALQLSCTVLFFKICVGKSEKYSCTLNPRASSTRISAGTLSPNFTKMMSPITSFSALTLCFSPSRRTVASYNNNKKKINKKQHQIATWNLVDRSVSHSSEDNTHQGRSQQEQRNDFNA